MQDALLLPYLAKSVFHCFRYTDCLYRPMLSAVQLFIVFNHFLARELGTWFSTSASIKQQEDWDQPRLVSFLLRM